MDETPWSGVLFEGFGGRTWTPLDPGFHLAKVEVASSNLVIRSRKPRFGGVSSFVSSHECRWSRRCLAAVGHEDE